MRGAAILTALVLLVLPIGAYAAGPRGVPFLAGPWASYQEGYGHVEPPTIYNGGDVLGRVRDIEWLTWSGPRAVGVRLSTWVGPHQVTAEGTLQTAVVVLFHLGYCHGRRAYDAIEWYFPEHGGHFRPHTYLDACTGQYR
jgi:hypothetical protein